MKVFASSILALVWSPLIDVTTAETCLNILITNDDGYDTLFIQSLFGYLKNETCHNALIAAPKQGQSGMSGAITFLTPIEIGNPEEGVYYADTTPSGAVLFGLDVVGPENDFVPDIVVSGPNEGHNLGYVTMHSGTVAAATTALARNIPAIAVSASTFDVDDAECAKMIAKLICLLLDTVLLDAEGSFVLAPGQGVNVNIPPLYNGSGDIDDYEYQLTSVGRESTIGALKFYRDFADSPFQREFYRGLLNGTSGAGLEFPAEAYGYPADTESDSEGNAIGIDLLDSDPEPLYVITVSPISFSYGRSPSLELQEAFSVKTVKPCKAGKPTKAGKRDKAPKIGKKNVKCA